MQSTKRIFSIIVVVIFLTLVGMFVLGAFKGEIMVLPEATLYTLARLFVAYIISLIFALIFGIYCAFERDVAKIWLPIIDVLQTVPILAFFPVAIELIINILGGGNIAYETASIFLVFTTMFWNLFYAVYDSINSIPKELQSFTHVFRIPFLFTLKYVYIPISIPNIVSNSIISWANGWFFIVLNEYVFYQSKLAQGKGIGVFVYNAYTQGNIPNIIIAILWVSLIIIMFHLFIWERLLLLSGRFKVGTTGDTPMLKTIETKKRNISKIRTAIDFLHKFYKHLLFIPYIIKIPKLPRIHIFHFKPPKGSIKKFLFDVTKRISIFVPLFVSVVVIIYLILQVANLPINYVLMTLKGFAFSTLRIIIAVFLCLIGAFFLNIYFKKNSMAEATIIPFMQMISAIPVSILMPLIFFFSLKILGFPEIGRVFILVSTSFWYVFFNIYAGFKRLPNEYEMLADVYKIKGIHRYNKIYIPWILSAVLVGIHTAQGASWNAIIIAEYMEFEGEIYTTAGIGSNLMYNYLAEKNMPQFSFDLLFITVFIVVYSFIFKKFLLYVENKYKYEF